MEKAIAYLLEKYDPVAMILYGSYGDGTMDTNSDLDILVVTPKGNTKHDMSVIDGIELDAFVYPQDQMMDFDPAEFLQLYDGKVIFQSDFDAHGVICRVRDYVSSQPVKSREEIESDVQWCEKMLHRTLRCDPEGYYRWHWVLTESLQIFCDIVGKYYFGPKKSIIWMKTHYPESYERYCRALAQFESGALAEWIQHLRSLFEA